MYSSSESTILDNDRKLIKNYMILSALTNSTWMLTDGFFVLFILDHLGYQTATILLSIQFILQSALDYPTGAFADWIGHRAVLISSFAVYALSFFLLGIFSIANPSSVYLYFLIIIILRSFASAQQSGALQSWYDNRYNIILGATDPDKKRYGDIFGKSILLNRATSFILILLGAFLAKHYSREFLFRVQVLFILVGMFFIFQLMVDFGITTPKTIKISEYKQYLIDGIRVIFITPSIFYLTLAYLTIITILNIYMFVFLFPIYYGYSGSDEIAYLLRSIIFLLGIAMVIIASVFSKKLNSRDWLVKTSIIYTFLWNGFFLLLLWRLPISILESEAEFHPYGVITLVALGVLMAFISTLWMILYQRIIVEEIPNKNRNSYYSFMPTVGMLVSAIFFPLIGQYIEQTRNFLLPFFVSISLLCLLSLVFTYLSKYCYQNIKCNAKVGKGTASYN